MEVVFRLVILVASFVFGLISINNPFVIVRLIALWFKFISGSSFEQIKNNRKKIKEAFELIDQPDIFMEKFSDQIKMIRFTGFTALFVAITGTCLFLLSGLG